MRYPEMPDDDDDDDGGDREQTWGEHCFPLIDRDRPVFDEPPHVRALREGRR